MMNVSDDQIISDDCYETLTLSLFRIRGYAEPSDERLAQIMAAAMARVPTRALRSADGITAAIVCLDAQVKRAEPDRQPCRRPRSRAPFRIAAASASNHG